MSKKCQYKYCDANCYGDYCFRHKPRKPITQRGKKTIKYEHWRDTVARPYLDAKYGRQCSKCTKMPPLKSDGTRAFHDIDHINKRRMGGAPSRTMDINNIRYLCRSCHGKRK